MKKAIPIAIAVILTSFLQIRAFSDELSWAKIVEKLPVKSDFSSAHRNLKIQGHPLVISIVSYASDKGTVMVMGIMQKETGEAKTPADYPLAILGRYWVSEKNSSDSKALANKIAFMPLEPLLVLFGTSETEVIGLQTKSNPEFAPKPASESAEKRKEN